jgi:protein involved in polysaccharide export with SLBB domain
MKALSLILMLFFSLLAVGCASKGPIEPAPATLSGGIPIYVLAPDDKLRISVYGEEKLAGEFMVGSDGSIAFPLVGTIGAAGLTVTDLQAKIAHELGAVYMNNPRVTVDIMEYRPIYVLGEVNKAGQFPYRVGMTVNAAVATAGGFTYRANQKIVAVQHYDEVGEKRYQLTSDVLVRPGDTIRILERFF